MTNDDNLGISHGNCVYGLLLGALVSFYQKAFIKKQTC